MRRKGFVIAALLFGGYWFFYGRKSSEHYQQVPTETYVDAPGFARPMSLLADEALPSVMRKCVRMASAGEP